MPRVSKYLGTKVGRLTVVGEAFKVREDGVKIKYYVCRCDCSVEKLVHESGIRKGRIKSCGCWKKEVDAAKAKQMGDANRTHGMSRTRIYHTWDGMRRRCDNPKDKNYKHYGGRGISYAPRWQVFDNFYEDMKEGYQEHLTIERVDVNGNYCKENCTWIPADEQNKNRRNSRKNR